MDTVLAFKNRGEFHFVAEDFSDLRERIVLNEVLEVSAGQCDDCGSFDPETGEPGRGFLIISDDNGRYIKARCGCCGVTLPVDWHAAEDTVF